MLDLDGRKSFIQEVNSAAAAAAAAAGCQQHAVTVFHLFRNSRTCSFALFK